MSEVGLIQIKDISRDPSTQPRERMSIETVEEYAQAMADGDTFPPIVVFENEETEKPFLASGWHRVMAAEQAGKDELLAEVREGDREDAIRYAAGVNALHGLRRTNADKRRAIAMLLSCERWADRSDNWIAEIAHVSDKTVAAVRTDLSDVRKSEPEKRIGKDGKAQPAKKPKKAKPQTEDEKMAEKEAEGQQTLEEGEEHMEAKAAAERTFMDAIVDMSILFNELPQDPAQAAQLAMQMERYVQEDRAGHIAWWFTLYAETIMKAKGQPVPPPEEPEDDFVIPSIVDDDDDLTIPDNLVR